MTIEIEQKKICLKYGASFFGAQENMKVGVSDNVKSNLLPINGLRHPAEGDTTGWYIWSGEEFSDEDNFFKPLHVNHLSTWNIEIMKYLGLPPGWRFLFAEDYEDVWFDKSLLNIQRN